MSDRQNESLNAVLRCEMTAVNQQFIHVLALRDWGHNETAERIMAVDRVDYPNAMRIIDHLVQTGAPVVLASERPTPGASHGGILAAERALERRFLAVIDSAVCTGDRARALIAAARAPREGYAAWLAEQLDGPGADEAAPAEAPFPETGGVLAHLIVMIEQALVHAFVHWHRGDAGVADAAWATSGAAMMQATELVRLFAARQAMPRPGEMPALEIAGEPAVALDLDRRLAGRCATEAAAAAEACDNAEVAGLCGTIADHASRLSRWTPGRAHPAANHDHTVFRSFETALRRHVWR
ncbi:MAG: hypothetical protein ACE5EU_09835 [Paracoccaceae bacterium]